MEFYRKANTRIKADTVICLKIAWPHPISIRQSSIPLATPKSKYLVEFSTSALRIPFFLDFRYFPCRFEGVSVRWSLVTQDKYSVGDCVVRSDAEHWIL
jgi:hypothetical protein